MRNAPRAAAAAIALFVSCVPSHAAFQTFVSATGNDSRPCTVQSLPCRTLQRAINVTDFGGEVRILSALGAQFVQVTKPLTISGGGNTMIGTITVAAGPSVVAIRELTLSGRGGVARGINILNAGAVHIENCIVERCSGIGIALASGLSTDLSISDSLSRNNGDSGLVVQPGSTARVTIVRSQFDNNALYGMYVGGGQSLISDSTASGNTIGILLQAGSTNITRTIVATNDSHGVNLLDGQMTINSSTARGNATGLRVDGGTARLLSNVFTENVTGVSNGGAVASALDNTIDGNTTDTSGTAFTTLTLQ